MTGTTRATSPSRLFYDCMRTQHSRRKRERAKEEVERGKWEKTPGMPLSILGAAVITTRGCTSAALRERPPPPRRNGVTSVSLLGYLTPPRRTANTSCRAAAAGRNVFIKFSYGMRCNWIRWVFRSDAFRRDFLQALSLVIDRLKIWERWKIIMFRSDDSGVMFIGYMERILDQ